MPLYGGGNKNKRKGTRRGQGNAQKQGQKGIAAQYITRNKAIKKLQISLKDFRRLCILKGIYPRDPRKKKEGKDKTYYHIKDIQYLNHEPLLIKFRELKIFLKKHKKAISRRDYSRAKALEENKPVFSLAHLIKERYPTFLDALRDLDDPLCMIHLFGSLPSNVTEGKNQHTPEKAFDCEKLGDEFDRLVIHSHALRKVFVSIKGIYYQAKVQGTDITWLVPHQFNQVTPDDVDYRVMLTFLQFYCELQRFVNLKLYHDNGLNYPPVIDQHLYENRAGLKSLRIQTKEAASAAAAAGSSKEEEKKTNTKASTVDSQTKKALQKSVAQVVQKLNAKKKKGGKQSDAMDTTEDAAAEEDEQKDAAMADEDDFAKLTGADPSSLADKSPEELDAIYSSQVFKGLSFLLSREVPHHSLEFVILCGGGTVASERDLSAEEIASGRFTHQIVDRPIVNGNPVATREYVQPQWVFDSFNSYNPVPTKSYAPGIVPPPHLSPFVKEEEDESIEALPEAARATVYIPKQREVLQSWGAKASWLRKKQAGFDAAVDAASSSSAVARRQLDPEEAEAEQQAKEEAKLQKELALERKGLSHSEHVEQQQKKKEEKKVAKKSAKNEEEDEEDEDENGAEDEEEDADESDGEGDIVPDSEDDEEDEDAEEEEEEAPKPASRKRKAEADVNDPQELAKAMMAKKDKRLFGRMMYGIDKKKAAVNKLEEKREALEQAAKKQKTASKKK